jgi:hypothetical protein
MYLIGLGAGLMYVWGDVLGLESFLCARVNLFLLEYLGTPLCDRVYGLVIKVSMVLYF